MWKWRRRFTASLISMSTNSLRWRSRRAPWNVYATEPALLRIQEIRLPTVTIPTQIICPPIIAPTKIRKNFWPEPDALAQAIMARFIHPEQGYRSILGLLRLVRNHGRERVDAACAQALSLGAYSSRNVNAILKHWQESPPESEAVPLIHGNLRTGEYYATNSE